MCVRLSLCGGERLRADQRAATRAAPMDEQSWQQARAALLQAEGGGATTSSGPAPAGRSPTLLLPLSGVQVRPLADSPLPQSLAGISLSAPST